MTGWEFLSIKYLIWSTNHPFLLVGGCILIGALFGFGLAKKRYRNAE